MTWRVFVETFRSLAFLDEASNDVPAFDDTEYIAELDRQTMIMLWNQMKLCFYRFRMNDLLYNGHTLDSAEVIALDRAMDKLMMIEANAKNQYRESQRIINNGGQL